MPTMEEMKQFYEKWNKILPHFGEFLNEISEIRQFLTNQIKYVQESKELEEKRKELTKQGLSKEQIKEALKKIELPQKVLDKIKETVDNILKNYATSLTYPYWIYQGDWKRIKNDFVEFLKEIYPNLEIWQTGEHLAPDINTLLEQIKLRLNVDFYKKVDPAIVEQISLLKKSIQQKYQKENLKIYSKIYSQYLCSIDLAGIGGDTVHIWRTGTAWWFISGDYGIQDEFLIEVLAKAFFVKYYKEKKR